MSSTVTLPAYAKINWLLRVFGRRPDGYHDIETIFQTITVHDTLRVSEAEAFSFRCDDPSTPQGEANLVVRAARLMSKSFSLPPVAIELRKRVPQGAGLGGGSSDAAATIRALAQLFDLDVSASKLRELSLLLGSDVPFFLGGGIAHATGRGEELQPLAGGAEIPLLLAIPAERVSTAEAYRFLNETERTLPAPLGLERARKIVSEGLLRHASELANDFESVMFARIPVLAELKRQMLDRGAVWTAMSGSGSTIVGAFRDLSERDQAASRWPDTVAIIPAETIA